MSDESDTAAGLDFLWATMEAGVGKKDYLIEALPLGGELLAMLRELEWAGSDINPDGNGWHASACPDCGAVRHKDPAKPGVHSPGCRLDALLRRYKR